MFTARTAKAMGPVAQDEMKVGGRYRAVLHLHDECPRIGSGRRIVDVKVGRDWIRLVSPTTGDTGRLSRTMFAAILAKSPGKKEENVMTDETQVPSRQAILSLVQKHNQLLREIIAEGGGGRERMGFENEEEANQAIARLESQLKALKSGNAAAERQQEKEEETTTTEVTVHEEAVPGGPGLTRLRKSPKAEEIRNTVLAEQKGALETATEERTKVAEAKAKPKTAAKAKKATTTAKAKTKTAAKRNGTGGGRRPGFGDDAKIAIKSKDLSLRQSRAEQLELARKHGTVGAFLKAGGRRGFLRFLVKNKHATIS